MKKKFNKNNNNTSTQETEPLTPQEQAQKQLDELAKKGVVFGDASVPSVNTGSTAVENAEGSIDESDDYLKRKGKIKQAGFLGGVESGMHISI